MTMELTTLAARRDLIPTVAGWLQGQWPANFADRDAEAYLSSQAQTESLPIGLLVLDRGIPAGTIAITSRRAGPWLEHLFVEPGHRGQGIGQLLTVSACRIAWAMGHEHVHVAASDVALFRAVGFEVVGETEEHGEVLALLAASKPPPPPSLYDEIGGEAVVRALVDRFYDLMDERPDAAEVRAMHAPSLKSSRQKLFEFLTGWLGGPPIYVTKHGHPRLRARHLPFSIGTRARDQWLGCMEVALEETITDPKIREQIGTSFIQMADHMRNRPGE